MKEQKLSRRDFLLLTGGATAGTLLAACQPQVVEKTVEVPVEVTREVEVETQVEVTREVEVETQVEVTAAPPPMEETHCRFITGAPATYYRPDDFNAMHPWARVDFEQLGDRNMQEVVLTSIAGGDPPDLAWPGVEQLWIFAQIGAAMDITPLMEASPHPELDKIHAESIAMTNSPGYFPKGQVRMPPGQYGWPVYDIYWTMYANVRLLEDAGLDIPDNDWTWDEWRELMLQVNDPGNQVWGFVVPGLNTNFVNNLIWANGGTIYDAAGKSAYNSPEAVEALQFMQDVVIQDGTALTSATAEEGLDWFSGNIAFRYDGMWGIGWYDAALEDPYKLLLWPQKARRAVVIGTDGFMFLTGSQEPEAAWEYAKWLTSYEGQSIINDADEVEVLSVNSEASKEAYINAQEWHITEEDRQIVTTVYLDRNVTFLPPFIPTGPGFDYNSAFDGLWLGDSVEDTLNDLAETVDSLNAQATVYG